jgi:hypothetical protein
MEFQSRVRQRLLQVYNDIHSEKTTLTRKIGRVLQITYEHEAFHAEVLIFGLSPCDADAYIFMLLDFVVHALATWGRRNHTSSWLRSSQLDVTDQDMGRGSKTNLPHGHFGSRYSVLGP